MPSTARLLSTAIAASTALLASAQSTIPLAAKSFSYPDGIPYKVDTDDGPRGIQTGINLCNATTEGQESRCQTSFINSIEDFCLWAPPEPDSIVGNTEGEMVAWCTQPGRGTRLIPEGALRGVQFTRAPSYVQVVGFIDQTQINIAAGDYGGEMDPHGADRRGNPLGGLLFSQAFGGGGNGSAWTQVVQWHNFMGGDMFCLKACDPADENDWHFCEHIFDRIGCAYNAPADYASINGTFTSCESDNQRYPGVYVNSNGQTVTYTQPAESLGAISTIPYTAEIPSSSQCTTFTSANLWTQLAADASSASTSAASDASSAASSAPTSAGTGSTRGTTAAGTGTTRAAGAGNNAQTTSGSTGAAVEGRSIGVALAGLAGIAAVAVML